MSIETTTTEAFEALMPEPDHSLDNGTQHFYTANQMREAIRAATERAAKQEREKAKQLLQAAKDLSKMYAHAWDLVDGGLTMMGDSVPLFEKRHKAVSKAVERYEAAASIGSGKESAS